MSTAFQAEGVAAQGVGWTSGEAGGAAGSTPMVMCWLYFILFHLIR